MLSENVTVNLRQLASKASGSIANSISRVEAVDSLSIVSDEIALEIEVLRTSAIAPNRENKTTLRSLDKRVLRRNTRSMD